MRRRLKALLVAIGTFLAFTLGVTAAAIFNLATNAASATNEWPWVVDWIRTDPWRAFWIGLGLSGTLGWLTAKLIGSVRADSAIHEELGGSGGDRNTRATTGLDFSNATFQAPVAISQGGMSAIVPNGPQARGDRDGPSGGISVQRSYVLYHVSAFLAESGWEYHAVNIAEEINPGVGCLELREGNLDLQGVAAVVVILSAAHYLTIKGTTKSKLKQAKENYPNVRVIVVAVGLADQQVSEPDVNLLLKSAGYKAGDEKRFLVCETEEKFRSALAQQLHAAVRVGLVQRDTDISKGMGQLGNMGDR